MYIRLFVQLAIRMNSLSYVKACFFAGFFLLTGCQGTPQTDQLAQQIPTDLPLSHTIENVPFYAQEQYYCGPTTLAEVFNFYGETINADTIAPHIFIPEKQGSLQLEMITATRQYNFLPYSTRGTLTLLMQLVSSDIPVIVFQNLSIQLLPQWHYAVVTGFNLADSTLTLHTGVTPDHTMSFALFEKTWGRGNYWLLAPVPPNTTSPFMDAYTYTRAAYDMLDVGKQEQAVAFLKTATNQWPDQWLAYFLLANYYLNSQPELSITWFEKGYHVGQYQSAYSNNYAHVLASSGNVSKAKEVLMLAQERFPENEDLNKTALAISAKH